jgi:hypothetical protein
MDLMTVYLYIIAISIGISLIALTKYLINFHKKRFWIWLLLRIENRYEVLRKVKVRAMQDSMRDGKRAYSVRVNHPTFISGRNIVYCVDSEKNNQISFGTLRGIMTATETDEFFNRKLIEKLSYGLDDKNFLFHLVSLILGALIGLMIGYIIGNFLPFQ